jgi:hypothetical protein
MNVGRQGYFTPLLEKVERWARKLHAPQVVLTTQDTDGTASGCDLEAFADGLAGAELYKRLAR